MLNDLLEMDRPQIVYGEIQHIVLGMFPKFSFDRLEYLSFEMGH